MVQTMFHFRDRQNRKDMKIARHQRKKINLKKEYSKKRKSFLRNDTALLLPGYLCAMENFRTQKSRQRIILNRFQQRGCLSLRRTHISTLLSLLALLPAFVSISCRKEGFQQTPLPQAPADSVLTTIIIRKGDSLKTRNLQLLLYDADGTRSLEALLRFSDVPDTVKIKTPEGEKLVAAIANSPRSLSPVALSRYDSLAELGFDFCDEDFSYPVMSAQGMTVGNNAELVLEPLLCCVEIASISNSMDNYELVESPRVRLVNINSYAGIMQDGDFNPTEVISYGEWEALPYDIGMFTQHPGTELHCYPNGTDPDSITGMNTALELECVIMGKTCRFSTGLPPFGRNSRILVEMTVGGPDSFMSKVTVVKDAG